MAIGVAQKQPFLGVLCYSPGEFLIGYGACPASKLWRCDRLRLTAAPVHRYAPQAVEAGVNDLEMSTIAHKLWPSQSIRDRIVHRQCRSPRPLPSVPLIRGNASASAHELPSWWSRPRHRHLGDVRRLGDLGQTLIASRSASTNRYSAAVSEEEAARFCTYWRQVRRTLGSVIVANSLRSSNSSDMGVTGNTPRG